MLVKAERKMMVVSNLQKSTAEMHIKVRESSVDLDSKLRLAKVLANNAQLVNTNHYGNKTVVHNAQPVNTNHSSWKQEFSTSSLATLFGSN